MVRAIRRRRKKRLRSRFRVGGKLRDSLGDGIKVRRGESPNGKISVALMNLVDPFREPDMDFRSYRALVALGTAAWNLSVTEGTVEDLIEELCKAGGQDLSDCRALLQKLVRRKHELFSDDGRFIVEWEVEQGPRGFYVWAAGLGYE